MSTEEIPRAQWNGFFDSFSRRHEGWITRLELLEGSSGPQHGALAFEGISLNSDDIDGDAIVISLATSPTEHVTHMIDHPRHVWWQRNEESTNASLEIEDNEQARTLLRLRSPMLPEWSTGIVERNGA